MDIKILEFGSLQEGWQGINEYLLLECEEIEARGGGLYSTEMISYDNYIKMRRGWVDPEFNFGRVLGYSKMKWSALVGNYVDMKYLDLLRSEVTRRVKIKSDSYNYSFHFSNHHGHGKDCLISLLFSKRLDQEHPTLIFSIRTSEVTKRLIWDFLLVQRIGEYVYGHNNFEVHLFAPSMYITCESIVMYNNVNRLDDLLAHRIETLHRFQKKSLDRLHEFINHPDPNLIKYRVHRRSAVQVRRDAAGNQTSPVKDLFAKNLGLFNIPLELPKEAITKKQIKNAIQQY